MAPLLPSGGKNGCPGLEDLGEFIQIFFFWRKWNLDRVDLLLKVLLSMSSCISNSLVSPFFVDFPLTPNVYNLQCGMSSCPCLLCSLVIFSSSFFCFFSFFFKDTTCNAGTFLPFASTVCSGCQPGQYSLGGGDVINQWTTLPANMNTECSGSRYCNCS